MSLTFLVLSTFLASSVESVEALTIVLATGITRGWYSTLLAVAAALFAQTAPLGLGQAWIASLSYSLQIYFDFE